MSKYQIINVTFYICNCPYCHRDFKPLSMDITNVKILSEVLIKLTHSFFAPNSMSYDPKSIELGTEKDRKEKKTMTHGDNISSYKLTLKTILLKVRFIKIVNM